ncbi:LEA type 2 family protein [Cytophaga aurantiaca]|uniref:NDR1/HIN1-like protein n=1 Tax=Cytophaga aurantiaca TaxID=29530 RepID=UPI0003713366|nr:LEA type 2 family protein [Cytophaga aurantiaca]
MKKYLAILIILLLIGGIIYTLTHFYKKNESIEEAALPSITIAKVDLIKLTSERADLLAHIQLVNNVPIGISIDSITYVIFVENEKIGKSSYAEPINIDANDTSTITIPLSINYKERIELFERLRKEGRDSSMLKIDAILYSSLIPKGSAKIKIEKKIPLILIPKIEVKKFKIEKLTTSETELGIDLLVLNNNTTQFSFSNFKYRIKIEDEKEILGEIPGTIQIKPNDSTSVHIPVQLSFKQISRTLADYIKKGKKMKYDITITTKPQTDIHSLKDSELMIHSNGEIGMLEN